MNLAYIRQHLYTADKKIKEWRDSRNNKLIEDAWSSIDECYSYVAGEKVRPYKEVSPKMRVEFALGGVVRKGNSLINSSSWSPFDDVLDEIKNLIHALWELEFFSRDSINQHPFRNGSRYTAFLKEVFKDISTKESGMVRETITMLQDEISDRQERLKRLTAVLEEI